MNMDETYSLRDSTRTQELLKDVVHLNFQVSMYPIKNFPMSSF